MAVVDEALKESASTNALRTCGASGRMGQEIQKAFAEHTLSTVDINGETCDDTPQVIVDFLIAWHYRVLLSFAVCTELDWLLNHGYCARRHRAPSQTGRDGPRCPEL